MKSKKLFAILTLVAFMMTLLPMAAFGAATYSASASYITVDKTSTATSGTTQSPIKVTLVARDSAGASILSSTMKGVYVKSDNDAVKVGLYLSNTAVSNVGGIPLEPVKLSTSKTVYLLTGTTSAEGAYTPVKTDSNGRVVFYVYSNIASTANLKFYTNEANRDDKVLIGEKALTFTSSAASVDDIYFRQFGVDNLPNVTAGSKVQIIAKVYDGSNNGMADKDVEWFVKKGASGSYVSLGTIKTDEFGDSTYTVYPTEATDYYYKAKVGDKVYTATAKSTVTAATPVKIEAKDAVKYSETNETFNANFFAYDTFGNKVTDATNLADIDWTVTSVPTDSGVQKDSTSVFGAKSANADDKYIYSGFTPDVAGEYTVKASIPSTGISATMKVTAGKFGTVNAVKVQFPKVADGNRSIGIKTSNQAVGNSRWLGNAKKLEIKLVDQNGVEKDASESDVILSSSNQDLIKIDGAWNTGGTTVWNRVYAPVNNTKGVATVTAIDKETGKSGSFDIQVFGGAATIAETVTVNDKVATVALQLKDSDGKNTFDSETSNTDYEVFASGATVDSKIQFKRVTGAGSFTLTSSDYASKDVTVVMVGGLSKTFKVNFTPAAPAVEGAAKNVTMFIGSKGFTKDSAAAVCEIAPFIKDSRTFVEVRAVANAFGVKAEDIGFANGVVTLKRSDVTVTITLGSKDITTSAGKTISMDVAAYVTPEGRTVLPMKFIGDAFGYTAVYDAVTGSVSFTR